MAPFCVWLVALQAFAIVLLVLSQSRAADVIGAQKPVNGKLVQSEEANFSGAKEPVGGDDEIQQSSEGTTVSSSITPETSVNHNLLLERKSYPFVVGIHYAGNVCSGGILNASIVVTTCSCVLSRSWPNFVTGEGMVIKIDLFPRGTKDFHVANAYVHPNCRLIERFKLWSDDAAILILNPPLNLSSTVSPMMTPNFYMLDAPGILQNMSDHQEHCLVVGWGSDSHVKALSVELVPMAECVSPHCPISSCAARDVNGGVLVQLAAASQLDIYPGAVLQCGHVAWGLVDLYEQCPNQGIYSVTGPDALLYAKNGFVYPPGLDIRQTVPPNNSTAEESTATSAMKTQEFRQVLESACSRLCIPIWQLVCISLSVFALHVQNHYRK